MKRVHRLHLEVNVNRILAKCRVPPPPPNPNSKKDILFFSTASALPTYLEKATPAIHIPPPQRPHSPSSILQFFKQTPKAQKTRANPSRTISPGHPLRAEMSVMSKCPLFFGKKYIHFTYNPKKIPLTVPRTTTLGPLRQFTHSGKTLMPLFAIPTGD